MSALTSPVLGSRLREGRVSFVEAAHRHRAQLRLVPEFTAQVSHRMFWGVLIALIISGTTLLLMLNVTLQNQAFALRTLAAHEQVLQNQEAAMQQELTQRSSSAELARSAVDLGMVPAISPGFVMLPDGTIVGDPEPVAAGGPYAGLRTPAEPPAEAPAAFEGATAPADAADAGSATIDPAATDPAVSTDPAAAGAATTDPAAGQPAAGAESGQAAAPSAVRTPEAAVAPTEQPTTAAGPESASSPEE